MKNKHRYAACVSPYSACEQIVKTAACTAADEGSELTVISVITPSELAAHIDFIDYLQELSHDCSAHFAVISSATPAVSLVQYIKKSGITHAFMGTPVGARGFGHDVIELSKKTLSKDLSVIQLPPLEEQSVSYIDAFRASELSFLAANRNALLSLN